MKKKPIVSFEVGDDAEMRTFEAGFRGAWFRCKITQRKEDEEEYLLQYYDFPDEENDWTKLYQEPPHSGRRANKKRRELMLRPRYPDICKEKQMPHDSEISEVTVIVDDAWKVGDSVDWLTNNCYWSGKIIQLLGDGKAQIELLPEPLGEGLTYEALLEDVRPSLDWSPEYGWMVPTQDGNTGQPRARLIKPINPVMKTKNAGQETQVPTGSPVELPFSSPLSSHSIAVSDELKNTGTMDMQKRSLDDTISEKMTNSIAVSDELKNTGTMDMQKRSLDDTISEEMTNAETIMSPNFEHHSIKKTSDTNTNPGQIPAEPAAKVEELHCSCPPKFRSSEGVTLNSTRSDTMEAAVMDLEEYLNKVKWLKKILLNGISSSDAPRSKWELVDLNAASSKPK